MALDTPKKNPPATPISPSDRMIDVEKNQEHDKNDDAIDLADEETSDNPELIEIDGSSDEDSSKETEPILSPNSLREMEKEEKKMETSEDTDLSYSISVNSASSLDLSVPITYESLNSEGQEMKSLELSELDEETLSHNSDTQKLNEYRTYSDELLSESISKYASAPNPIVEEASFHSLKKPNGKIEHSEMVIVLDVALTEHERAPKSNLNSIKTHLGINKRHIFPTHIKSLLIPQSIEWRRLNRIKFNNNQEIMLELNEEKVAGLIEEHFLIVVLLASDLVSLITSDQLKKYCSKLKNIHAGKQITILLVELERWMKCNQTEQDLISKLEEAVIWIQFESGCYLHQTNSSLSAANFIELFTETVAESLYKYIIIYYLHKIIVLTFSY